MPLQPIGPALRKAVRWPTVLIRGGVLAVVHAAAQTITAAFAVINPTSQTTLSALCLACWWGRRGVGRGGHLAGG